MPDNVEVAVIAPGTVSVSLTGGAAHDMIMGNELRNIISGGNGNDTLNGQGGDDEISGGEGNDLLIAGVGARYLDGGAGDDVILVGNTVLADIMALFSLP
jgi:Ca2+-binding RTX toxin-like protein